MIDVFYKIFDNNETKLLRMNVTHVNVIKVQEHARRENLLREVSILNY